MGSRLPASSSQYPPYGEATTPMNFAPPSSASATTPVNGQVCPSPYLLWLFGEILKTGLLDQLISKELATNDQHGLPLQVWGLSAHRFPGRTPLLQRIMTELPNISNAASYRTNSGFAPWAAVLPLAPNPGDALAAGISAQFGDEDDDSQSGDEDDDSQSGYEGDDSQSGYEGDDSQSGDEDDDSQGGNKADDGPDYSQFGDENGDGENYYDKNYDDGDNDA